MTSDLQDDVFDRVERLRRQFWDDYMRGMALELDTLFLNTQPTQDRLTEEPGEEPSPPARPSVRVLDFQTRRFRRADFRALEPRHPVFIPLGWVVLFHLIVSVLLIYLLWRAL